MYYSFLNFFIQLFLSKKFIYILKYCILQNIITIALLPLYSSWGISFSSLSLIGNFIFAPLLIIYLILSIIILVGFCFQKWFLFIITIQKTLIDIWIYLLYKMSFFIPYGIFTFINNPIISYPLCWTLAGILIFNQAIKKNIYYYCLYSFISLISVLIILNIIEIKNKICIINDFNIIYIIRYIDENTVYLSVANIKKNFISKKKIEYVLLPEIKKNFGINRPTILYI